jgi:restriction system protein
MLDSVNPATGREERNCLISVRVTAETFTSFNLSAVQPERCLMSLNAAVSRSPADLLPVKPIIELNMVDPRFIETTEVLSGLDGRPNLMELSPGEFEGLITNLFEAMGLNTRQTQASRDGGVDCVAFDPRPVFGGKVVIQAKRYKNTVGVSAVRDLFGTMQNEGATKGILVTTSGYGNAAFEFAKGKPLELLDGGNLLYLLKEHANLDARIIMPEGYIESASDRH